MNKAKVDFFEYADEVGPIFLLNYEPEERKSACANRYRNATSLHFTQRGQKIRKKKKRSTE